MAEIPLYRVALKDSSHPMNSIAWDVFRETFNTEKVVQKHAERRDEILPFLYSILDSEDLHLEGSLGNGFAPINAVSLLGAWQVVEAIPRLLNYIDEDDDDLIIKSKAAVALQQMPPEHVIEPLLKYGQNEAKALDAMFILTHAGKDDKRCFNFICKMFEQQTDEFDIITIAECLAINDITKAEDYLQQQGKKKPFSKYKSDFEKIIAEVKRGD